MHANDCCSNHTCALLLALANAGHFAQVVFILFAPAVLMLVVRLAEHCCCCGCCCHLSMLVPAFGDALFQFLRL